MTELRVENIALCGQRVSVTIDAAGVRVDGLPEGIELVEEPRQPLTAATAG